MKISFKNLFFVLASIIALAIILHYAKDVLIPLCFAVLFAFILYPVVKWMSQKGLNKILSITLSIIGVIIIQSSVIFLFSTQIIEVTGQYSNLIDKLKNALDASTSFLNNKVQIIPDIKSKELIEGLSTFFSDNGFLMISDTVSVTSSFFSYLVLSFIYTFLILLYSKHLTKAVSYLAAKKNRKMLRKMLKEVQQVGQKYLTGMCLLILILGILNSLGLLILGIEYSFLFGFLAALLAVIPYVGSAVGGLIPTLYAFVTYDSYWYPIGVIAIFIFIQFLEGNFLSPKIVGGSLKINPLFSILSLIAGGFLWGIAGMILFLPGVAMLKVVCGYFDNLKPISILLGHYKEENNQESYSLIKRLLNFGRSGS
ncbi:MAG: AI-2E family transporter [Cyclobacteriaceae bacterium]